MISINKISESIQRVHGEITVMSVIDNSITDKEWYNIYWSYFELMSRQRISMLNFYISIEVVLFGGMFTLLQLQTRMHWAEYIVALSIVFMSILFYGLDLRTKSLIHKCEELMMDMEDKYKTIKSGSYPIHFINMQRKEHRQLTYSDWFKMQFFIIGCIGLIISIMVYCGKI